MFSKQIEVIDNVVNCFWRPAIAVILISSCLAFRDLMIKTAQKNQSFDD